MQTSQRAVEYGAPEAGGGGAVARLGVALANWSERWFPDPLVFAFLGIVAVFLGGLAAGEGAANLAIQAGKNFWTFVPFTMQMSMVIIGGYVAAMTPVAHLDFWTSIKSPSKRPTPASVGAYWRPSTTRSGPLGDCRRIAL